MTAKSRGRWVWIGLVLLSLLVGTLSSGGGATAQTLSPAERVDAGLLNALAEGGRSDFIIEMSEQADLSAAYSMTDWDARGQYVVDTLKATAARSQAPVVAALQKRGADFTSFFAGNVIYVRGGDQKMLEIALAQKGVGRVRAPVTAYITPAANRLAALGPELQDLDGFGPTWGLIDTKAIAFWDLFHHYGEGILVANIDTGVDYDHPALLPNYRCQEDPDDPACWYDPTAACVELYPDGGPCDDFGHGTHVMGTMAADNDPAFDWIVGMAPDAEWIACKGCNADRSCDTAMLLACGDWILHPDNNPANRPHVVNNSWGDKESSTWYAPVVTAWEAAGIFPVFSAGNAGPECDTIGSPADYSNSFAVGAYSDNRAIWSGSGRGPGGYEPFAKPNLSAPGDGIVSTIPVDDPDDYPFTSNTGTSMAAPHVAGAVALLWSLKPALIGDIDETFTALQDSADPPLSDGNCEAPPAGGGNYTYGHGYLNVLGSGEDTLGAVAGKVTDDFYDLLLDHVLITALHSDLRVFTTNTLVDGSYIMALPPGTYTLTAEKAGYIPSEPQVVEIIEDQTVEDIDFVLTTLRTWLPLITR